jgi:hypothetical protein
MHRAAGPVALQLRKFECFGDDSLARERGIAVNEDRENVVSTFLRQQILLGSHDSLKYRIDRLQMRGVGREVHGRVRAVGRQERSGGAEVVLHIARALDRVVAVVALEFAEDLRVGLTRDVRQNV